MIKSELSEGIVRYTFEPLPGRHWGNNIFALNDGNKVLLIDTAYEFQASLVLKDIRDSGLEIDRVIISHFHDDHMQGLKVLPKVPTYGSEHYNITLDMWTEKDEHKYFIPTVLIKDNYTMDFGKHHIVLIPFPGHSLCTIITKINDEYLHIADELMFSNEGKPILPSTDPNCIKRHVESLEKLKNLSSYIFLPSHGMELSGKHEISMDINNRISYFNAILSSNRKISYQEAVKNCDCEFLHSEWHQHVYE